MLKKRGVFVEVERERRRALLRDWSEVETEIELLARRIVVRFLFSLLSLLQSTTHPGKLVALAVGGGPGGRGARSSSSSSSGSGSGRSRSGRSCRRRRHCRRRACSRVRVDLHRRGGCGRVVSHGDVERESREVERRAKESSVRRKEREKKIRVLMPSHSLFP